MNHTGKPRKREQRRREAFGGAQILLEGWQYGFSYMHCQVLCVHISVGGIHSTSQRKNVKVLYFYFILYEKPFIGVPSHRHFKCSKNAFYSACVSLFLRFSLFFFFLYG